MRLAVIADVHGNALALEAVLADIRTRQVEAVINLGDCVSGPLWPAESYRLLRQAGLPTVRGNHDRWMAEQDPAAMGPSDRFAHERLDVAQIEWLGGLPSRLEPAPGVLAVHATPEDDNRYLVEEVQGGRLVRAGLEAVRARLGEVRTGIVLCGHSHQPGMVQLPDGPLVINPGSVGCPAYDDPDGPAHVSESGAPHARYAILTLEGEAAGVEWLAVAYAWEEAARRAEAGGRPDWAHALRTGFMPAA